jgi:WD40 repeat protein
MSRPILSILILMLLSMTACVPTTAVQAPPEPATQASAQEAQASQEPPALLVNAANRGLLYPIDPASGQALPDFEPIPLGKAYNYAFSPGADRLAFVSEGGQLTLIDLANWEYETFHLPLPRPAYQVTYSPDGERLAVAGGNRSSSLALIDTSQGSLIAESPLDFLVYQMKFTGDGSGLMVYGSEIQKRFTVNEMSPDPPWVALLDGSDLSARWTQALQGVQHGIIPTESARESEELDPVEDLHHSGQAIYLLPGLAFAPDRDFLYVAHAGDAMLTVVDFSARQVATHEIHDRMSWIERLMSIGAGRARAKVAAGTTLRAAISPDGRSLYVVGQTSTIAEQSRK